AFAFPANDPVVQASLLHIFPYDSSCAGQTPAPRGDASMHEGRFTFNRGAIRPIECLAGGWRLAMQDYWLFLGITLVGFIIAELASPILVGPAICGIHICFLRQANSQRVTF